MPFAVSSYLQMAPDGPSFSPGGDIVKELGEGSGHWGFSNRVGLEMLRGLDWKYLEDWIGIRMENAAHWGKASSQSLIYKLLLYLSQNPVTSPISKCASHSQQPS